MEPSSATTPTSEGLTLPCAGTSVCRTITAWSSCSERCQILLGPLHGARVRIVARTSHRANALASRFVRIASVFEHAADAVHDASLVVNATPVGLDGADYPMDPAFLPPGADILDLAYRRGETPWVHACRARGLRAADGLAMLVEQGALAFERWFGAIPDREAMWKAVRG